MKNKKYVVSFIMIFILLATSVGTYLCYPLMQEAVHNSSYDQDRISDFMADKMMNYNYAIDYELKSQTNPDFSLSEYYKITGEKNQDTKNSEESFYYFVKQDQHAIASQKDIFYQAKDTNTDKVVSNTSDDLKTLQENEQLKDKYQWYIQIQFDKDGMYTLHFSTLKNPNIYFYQSNVPSSEEFYASDDITPIATLDYNTPKNLIITYAVPQTLPVNGELALYLSYQNSSFLKYATPYILLSIIIVIFTLFMIPIRLMKDNKFFHFIAQIKFEILVFIWGISFGTMFVISTHLTSQNAITEVYKWFAIEDMAPILTPIINITFWFFFYALFAILAYMIKYLFDKGLKHYFIENTCIGWLIIHSQSIINKVINFDLNDNINRAVLKIVFLNFIIITIISFFWAFGFIPALIYSIVIFILLRNKFIDIQQDYKVLLHSTKKLSDGNFNVQINEDIGIFNPLKEEFSQIKNGFQKAVQEEVKSQKTKAELISNVSHDLKTPLTSIITYVDLLKDERLAPEDRKHYLQILERNSLRLKNLIDDLFEVSKANSGDIQLDLVDVDIVSLMKQAQLECSDKLLEKNLDLRSTYSNDKIICHLDSSKTYRIFENLFINISKYALQNTRVYLDITEDDETVTVIFKNIAEDEMSFNKDEIIERFVQGDKSRNTSGSGLGLAIVKSFTELQDGQFKIEIDGDLFKSILTFKK